MSKLITIIVTLLTSTYALALNGHYLVPGGHKYKIENIKIETTNNQALRSISYGLPKELYFDNYLTTLFADKQSSSSSLESNESLAKCVIDKTEREIICFIEFKNFFKARLIDLTDKTKYFIVQNNLPDQANLLLQSFELFQSEPIGLLKIHLEH